MLLSRPPGVDEQLDPVTFDLRQDLISRTTGSPLMTGTAQTAKMRLRIEGMDCASCATKIENARCCGPQTFIPGRLACRIGFYGSG